MIKKVAGVEITSESIRVVELEKDGPIQYLKNMARVSTPAGAIRDGEIVEIDKVSTAIRKLLNLAGITTKRAVVSLSGKGVVIQEVNLPSMPVAEMKEVIKSELEKYPIFKRDDFIFDYQFLSEFTEKGYKRVRVVLVGVSLRLLSSYLNCMQMAGLSVVSIDLAPLSMAASQYPGLGQGEATALVLIKNDKTYVTVLNKGEFCLFHNIEIGESQLLESGPFPENNLNQENLEKFIDELGRSFKFYEIEFETGKIAKAILSYDESKLPQLDKRIASMLGEEIKIEVANPLRQVKLPAKLAGDKIANSGIETFAVAVGAALRGLGMTGHNLSLGLLQEYIPRPEELKRKSVLCLIGCLLVMLISAGIFSYQKAVYNQCSRLLKEKEVQLASLNGRLEGLKDIAGRHRFLRERLQRQASYLRKLNTISWSVLLSKVTRQLPKEVWLKAFKSTDKGKLVLEGGAFSVDMIAEFIREMGEESTFEKVGLDSLKQKRFSEKVTGLDFKLESELSARKEKDDGNPKLENK